MLDSKSKLSNNSKSKNYQALYQVLFFLASIMEIFPKASLVNSLEKEPSLLSYSSQGNSLLGLKKVHR